MKTVYQVQSKFPKDKEWLDDHMPFDTLEEAIDYIKTQPKCFKYRITSWEESEIEDKYLELCSILVDYMSINR